MISDILTIDGYPIRSTARVFHDVDGNPCTLAQLIEREPEWAENRILDLEVQLAKAQAELDKARGVIAGLSLITNEMKAECIGEFSWQQDWPYYDEHGRLHDSVLTHTAPWDLVKTIYKRMLEVKLKPPTPERV